MIHRVTQLFSPVTIVLPTKQEIRNFVNFLISALIFLFSTELMAVSLAVRLPPHFFGAPGSRRIGGVAAGQGATDSCCSVLT